MLNPTFAFGVPIGLLVGYLIVSLIRNKKYADYRRFVLALISVFLTTFSYQVYRYSQTVLLGNSLKDFKESFNYTQRLLLIPLAIGSVLTIINFYFLFKQFRKKD
ncbi:hypothetical protein NRIC_15610 [Enterococcus florum]|uniref:Uncharacterized protein n=1 Tax=Enterococcus florum TaxID=2480627 RepID=A0A4P5P796_9ENTE|nr:hypothetical protein [Enterococcus florum]GCF93670.1 hypothetical protein NRIC_15610 [Enterococcus florum]